MNIFRLGSLPTFPCRYDIVVMLGCCERSDRIASSRATQISLSQLLKRTTPKETEISNVALFVLVSALPFIDAIYDASIRLRVYVV